MHYIISYDMLPSLERLDKGSQLQHPRRVAALTAGILKRWQHGLESTSMHLSTPIAGCFAVYAMTCRTSGCLQEHRPDAAFVSDMWRMQAELSVQFQRACGVAHTPRACSDNDC
jgi:hypothetical protein